MPKPFAMFAVLLPALLAAPAVQARIPTLNATCPQSIEVHADEGGPVYINGKEARLTVSNPNYFEASLAGTTISVSLRPDGTPEVSYARRGSGNGVCRVAGARAGGGDHARAPAAKALGTGQMTAFCKGEAAGRFGTRPAHVTANAPMKAVGGGFVVGGSVDMGPQGNPPFECHFDKAGHFTGLNNL